MGPPGDFTDFVLIKGMRFVRYGLVLTGDQREGVRLAQEALARLDVRKTDSPDTFIGTAMARLFVTGRRRRHGPGVPGADIARHGGDPDIWRQLAELPALPRAVIVLRSYGGLSNEEIARVLDLPPARVRDQAAAFRQDDLVRTLDAAAATAEPADLLSGLSRLRRRRTSRRLRSAAAAGLALATVTGLIVLVRPTVAAPADHVSATARPAPSRVGLARAAQEVWPRAVSRLPARSADGLVYQPAIAIDDRRVVLLAQRRLGHDDVRLDVYDAVTGRIGRFARLPPDDEVRWFATDGRFVVWSALGLRADDTMEKRFWRVPVKGGKPRLVTRAATGDRTAPPEIHFQLGGGNLLWDTGKAIYRQPLSGKGSRAKVRDGLRLLEWPWAADLAKGIRHDLESGRSREFVTSGRGVERCSPDWCVERHAISRMTVARRTDGSGTVELPGSTTDGPVLNRFVVLRVRAGLQVIKDLRTGTLATFDPPDPSMAVGLGDRNDPGTMLAWSDSEGRDLWILNLKAVR
ncbi:sigma factor-like helix-turn-helix DNA-binding protein [Nonomuraea sp. NPDC059194]|uniref:sigma factor-like helix-turn-helix DNA-binding protein n=1 Tax=Nonomuraea sp. NPDC059194 TaxID=3346764 RepID=UPI0036C984D9